MAEADPVTSICTPITDSTRIANLREDVAKMCKNDRHAFFPGAQPVSMDRENLKFLSQIKYCVCEKTDGVRYMLLIWKKCFYFIDRKYNFHKLNNADFTETVSFLSDSSMLNCIDLNKATVLDGEFLVETKDPSHPLCYWVFDIVCFNDRNVGNFSLLHRLQMVRSYITSPLNNAAKNDKLHLPFQIRYKPMYNLDQTIFVWNDIVPHLSHESDGLIFTPILDPYTAGACPKLLKWKPLHLNSADFKIACEEINGKICYRLQVLKDGLDGNYDWLSFETEEEEKEFGRGGTVVECIFDFHRWTYIPFWNGTSWVPSPRYAQSEKGPGWREFGWKPIRIRKDKASGNAERTVENVLKSITDNITIEDLDKFIPKAKKLDVCSSYFFHSIEFRDCH